MTADQALVLIWTAFQYSVSVAWIASVVHIAIQIGRERAIDRRAYLVMMVVFGVLAAESRSVARFAACGLIAVGFAAYWIHMEPRHTVDKRLSNGAQSSHDDDNSWEA